MNKSEVIHARVRPDLKLSAEGVFRQLGLSTTEAISLFLNQVVMHNGLPFEVKIPNPDTREAIVEVRAGKGQRFSSVKDLMGDLDP